MKKTVTLITALILLSSIVFAQDTLYIYKTGSVVVKRAVSAIDSIIFYQAGSSYLACGTTSAVTDIDGNTYNTVSIGSQCWMGGNLKTTKYCDNTAIPNVTDNTAWSNLTTGAYSDYNNTASNSNTYGRLYNWYAATDDHKICPTGWHMPTHDEWTTLERAICTSGTCTTDFPYDNTTSGTYGTDEGGKLKETGYTHWLSPNTGATNSSGFTALPGGDRDTDGYFYYGGSGCAFWWSAKESDALSAWGRQLNFNNPWVTRYSESKVHGSSVRCVKD